jgi:hypothetical protein
MPLALQARLALLATPSQHRRLGMPRLEAKATRLGCFIFFSLAVT